MSTTSTDGGVDYALYRYTPSIPAAAVFAVIFLVLSILHLLRLFRNRTYFFIPFIVGLLREIKVSDLYSRNNPANALDL